MHHKEYTRHSASPHHTTQSNTSLSYSHSHPLLSLQIDPTYISDASMPSTILPEDIMVGVDAPPEGTYAPFFSPEKSVGSFRQSVTSIASCPSTMQWSDASECEEDLEVLMRRVEEALGGQEDAEASLLLKVQQVLSFNGESRSGRDVGDEVLDIPNMDLLPNDTYLAPSSNTVHPGPVSKVNTARPAPRQQPAPQPVRYNTKPPSVQTAPTTHIKVPKIEYESFMADDDTIVERALAPLFAKYAPSLTPLRSVDTTSVSTTSTYGDLSMASLEYLRRYGLGEQSRVLDVERIRRLPKLGMPGM
ncbi:hypothetical protein SpCBS45565_g08150 [Spizellomyces sp. 'palustris']|nr:hypothetical protein SpCBS45565_g08150 [Spizellomyces sp. 'palustris']